MGVDITAYGGLKKLDVIFNENCEALDKSKLEVVEFDLRAYSNPDFPGRADGLEDRAAYMADAYMRVLSMGYHGYNNWREQLACMAGYAQAERETYGGPDMRHDAAAWRAGTGPFYELICFSDCEGTIGPVVAAKLAKDFADFDDKAKAHGEAKGLDRFYDAYTNMRLGFMMAADNGAIDFH